MNLFDFVCCCRCVRNHLILSIRQNVEFREFSSVQPMRENSGVFTLAAVCYPTYNSFNAIIAHVRLSTIMYVCKTETRVICLHAIAFSDLFTYNYTLDPTEVKAEKRFPV